MRPPPRWTARLAIALALVTLCLGIADGFLLRFSVAGGPPLGWLPVVAFMAFPVMGLLISVRQPRNPIGWLLFGLGMEFFLIAGSEDYAAYALIKHPGSLPFGQAAEWLQTWVWVPFVLIMLLFLPMLFPTGRLLSRRWWLVIAAGLLFGVLAAVGNAFQPGSVSSTYPALHNPLGIPGAASFLGRLVDFSVPFGAFALAGSIASVIVRYRRADRTQRQQLKWFLFASALSLSGFIANDINVTLSQLLILLTVPLVPIAIAIAIFRHRLYDIDLVINRAVVYGTLAAFITAVYVGIVVGIGSLIGLGARPNLLLSITATAVVSVAFQPVRQQLQRFANRLVYGRRATPYEILADLSHRVAGAYPNEEVLPRLARVLAEGTGAAAASVWLNAGAAPIAAATWPDGAPPLGARLADRVATVTHKREALGELTVKKRPGEPLRPVERALMNDLAAQAGQVLRNVLLTAELQERLRQISQQTVELRLSRQQLVSAQDAERRRLERNIHDGAQQHLVALAVKLRLAASLARKDAGRARLSIDQLRDQTADAIATLSALSSGLYPAILREHGIAAALRAQTEGIPVALEIDADGLRRYPEDDEAAVYFCCQEAIQNAVKHAHATRIRVRFLENEGGLSFTVSDDGGGFDPRQAAPGSGFSSMHDRLLELGGHLEVRSGLGIGTTVMGRLPIRAPEQVA
jgi:signal transduction histidine kinase